MKTIGWMGCLGFALVGLFQQSVINTMEKNYMESAKYSIPIVKETNKSKVIEHSRYSPGPRPHPRTTKFTTESPVSEPMEQDNLPTLGTCPYHQSR